MKRPDSPRQGPPGVSQRRAVVVAVLAVTLLSACTTGPRARASGATTAPAPSASTSHNAYHPVPIVQAALQATSGEPLVDPSKIISGGPGVDGIPAIDRPVHLSAAEAARSLVDTEQVLVVESDGRALAFPLRSLISHEIANDVLQGVPIAATWCPLCNTGIVYDRRVAGRATTFGVTGTLFASAMVMYDRDTRSLWTQPTGQAVAGRRTGQRLAVIPSSLLPWAEARRSFPSLTVVLGGRPELDSSTNPYEGYDSSDRPFLFHGQLDPRLPPFERVAGVSFAGVSRSWSFSLLRARRVLQDTVAGQPLVLFWAPGTASPLDTPDLRKGRDVGSAAVYDPNVDGRQLTFQQYGQGFLDFETKSTWTLGGLALAGPFHGKRLRRLPSQDAFWFAWAAFNPRTELVGVPARPTAPPG